MYSDSEHSDSGYSSGRGTSSYESDNAGFSVRIRAPWKCDPAFGVVHQERCNICRHYMSHFVEGSRNPHDPSFHAAVSERDGRATASYLEGIEEGRRIQAEKDKAKVSRYREEREEARGRRHRADGELKRIRAELAEMRDAFIAMQITYEEQIAALTFGLAREEEDMQTLRMLELQDALFAGSSVREPDHAEELEILAIGKAIGDEGGTDGPSSDSDSGEDSEEGLGECSASDLASSESEGDVSDKDHLCTFSKAEARVTIDELSQQPTNSKGLLRVRNMFLEANSTPSYERTEAQRMVIREAWKFLGARGAVTTTGPTATPEIFVDASVKGIGFLWGDKWEAWELNKGWRTGGRDMPWAEMVAVELGLRTLIAAGLRSTHVRVRSDNHAVVTGLSARQMRGCQDAHILQEVQALCKAYDIVLMPVWIWTKSNPADALSRGKYPAREMKVEVRAEMPPHLIPFVRNIESRA
ncbi:hypothetical protein MD484_g1526, partial [Candolleomyces efflorescens]